MAGSGGNICWGLYWRSGVEQSSYQLAVWPLGGWLEGHYRVHYGWTNAVGRMSSLGSANNHTGCKSGSGHAGGVYMFLGGALKRCVITTPISFNWPGNRLIDKCCEQARKEVGLGWGEGAGG